MFTEVKNQPKNKIKKYTYLTQNEYDTIKLLIKAGLGISDIARIRNRSHTTVHYISRSTSFDDYHATVRAVSDKRRKKVEASKPEEKAADTSEAQALKLNESDKEPTAPVQPVVDETTLERIAVALERLADAWERTPEKKTSFFGK